MELEAVYPGNLGIMELIKFMDMASPEQKSQFQQFISSEDYDSALKLIQQVTGTELVPNVPEKASPKTIMAFDFDNTLVVSDSKVIVRHADGTQTELTPYDYPKYKKMPGDEFDFSQFELVQNPRRIEKYIRLLQMAVKSPNIDVVLLTARRNARPIADYLRSIGIEKGVRIAALGSGKPSAKLLYLRNKVRKGEYTDLYFFDDSEHNERIVGALRKEFPDVGVRVHTHLVPPEQYHHLMGKEAPGSIDRTAVQQALNHTIRNPETDNDILVKTALKYDKNHPAHKVARAYLSRVGRM